MSKSLAPFVESELAEAMALEQYGDGAGAFAHMERAHILSQYSTKQHVSVHFAMLRWAWQRRDFRETFGQLFRIAGAATKTAIGLVPTGNTGGANVSPIKPMPLPADLADIIAKYR